MNFKEYVSNMIDVADFFMNQNENISNLDKAVRQINDASAKGNKVILVGNGGSAAIAEHMAIDLAKNAGVRAMAISGTPQLTTFANDYGYENIFSKGVEMYADEGDILIAISSGGTSKNILNAVEASRTKKMYVITFSGFNDDNPLRKKGDINYYVKSEAYGYVELLHNIMLHYINDAIIGKVVYKFR